MFSTILNLRCLLFFLCNCPPRHVSLPHPHDKSCIHSSVLVRISRYNLAFTCNSNASHHYQFNVDYEKSGKHQAYIYPFSCHTGSETCTKLVGQSSSSLVRASQVPFRFEILPAASISCQGLEPLHQAINHLGWWTSAVIVISVTPAMFLCWPYAATSREISSPRKHMFHMSRHLFLLFPEKSGMANNGCRGKDVHFTNSISTTHSDHKHRQNERFTGRKSLRCRREGSSRDRRFTWDWENGVFQLCIAVLEGLSFSPRLPPHL
jgi:hypothetical protein